MVSKAALAAGLAALLAAAPVVTAGVAASTSVEPKVVIVVGPTEGTTSSYRSYADSIAATALKYTSNVVKIYSPNATWAAVSAAAQGASIFVDLGHGWGFPSPYTTTLTPNSEDGMALNATAGNGDSNRQYYGESYIANNIRFAPNAVVFLNHLCYAPGESEPGYADPTVAVAQQRVDNFASGYIRAGARAVVADDYIGSVEAAITSIFTTQNSMLSVWRSMPGYQDHEVPWLPARNPAFQAIIDPNTSTSGFWRSVVADPALTTGQILAGAATAAATPALTAPGAAAVVGSAPLYDDATLANPTGATLGASTTVRVDQLVQPAPLADGTTPPEAAEVHTLDGATEGWLPATSLAPRNSTGPELWSLTGSTTVSPNFDGQDDQLNLWARLSETTSWTAKILDPDGESVQTQTGTGDLVAMTWNGLVSGAPAPAGTYHWSLHATDALGNPALDTSGPVDVLDLPLPAPSVASFTSTAGAVTNDTTLPFQLTFGVPVTGLAAADFTLDGTATGCVVGTPTGSGTTWGVSLTNCSAGTVALTLAADAVLNPGAVTGPSAAVTAPTVVVDRTKPTAKAPSTVFRSNVTITGSTLLASVSWTASDAGGAGLASYDVARSVDGAAFQTLSSGQTSTKLSVSLTSGHSYRFEVRAHDRAGNVSAWVTGPTLHPSLVQQTSSATAWSSGWTTVSSSQYSSGSARSASTASRAVTYTFTGRAISLLLGTGPTYGQVKVYLDGKYVTTVDTTHASYAYRRSVYAKSFTYGSHSLKLVVVGTVNRPRVVVDAFEVMR